VPEIRFDIIPIKTKGDRDKITPLGLQENTDFFTREIEEALFNKRIDAAIHSAKDLEEDMPSELVIAAMLRSAARFDCLVSNRGFALDTLPSGSIIGTSSQNRKLGISRYRRDLVTRDIRGDIDERLAQLDRGDFDAIIVAHIALIRLRYEKRISQLIPSEVIRPHPLQGDLAIQIHRDRRDLLGIFRRIDEV
jgi:hydroxymethylbilane synthase